MSISNAGKMRDYPMNSDNSSRSSGGADLHRVLARLQWQEPAAVPLGVLPERRRSRRLAFFEGGVTITAPTGHQTSTAIVDISEDGLGVMVDVSIPVGTVIAVQCGSGFAVGAVQRCEEREGAYRWGISLENCIATRSTIKRLMELAVKGGPHPS